MRILAPEPRQAEYGWSLAPLVREHRAWVEAMARRHLGDPALAEEVAQDVFLRLARLPRPPAEAAALRAWLLRTVWFLSANARRKAARRRSVEALAAREFGGETGMNPPPSPEDLPLEELAAALDALPDPDRAMVLEHYFEGREHGEIGLRHRLSGEAARKRIARALARLRSCLVRRGVAALPSVSIAAVLGMAETSHGALVKAALAKSLFHSPTKTAMLTVMVCAAVTVPLMVSQQRRIQDLQNRQQQQQQRQRMGPETAKADFPGAGLPDSPWVDAGSADGWTPRSFNTEGFPHVPPMAQWILDTLPVLAAAARGGSREPLNLRLSITMNQSLSGLLPPRKAGLIDLDRVVQEYQLSSRGQAELEAARQRTERELWARENRMRSLRFRLAEVESALNAPLPAVVTGGSRQEAGGRERLMREAASLRAQVADQAGGTEMFRLRRAAQLEDAESRLSRSLRAEVIRHLQEKVREGRFDFLLDTSALIPGTGSLLSLDTETADIGPEVLKELRQP